MDAAFFHLYGLNRDDTAHILDTFPIVRRKDIDKHGTYRTKDIILEIYDALSEATRTGQLYREFIPFVQTDIFLKAFTKARKLRPRFGSERRVGDGGD